MDPKKLRAGINLASILTAAATASGAAIALTDNSNEYEDPGVEVAVANDRADVLLNSEGTLSRHYLQKERQHIYVQDFFARRLIVPFNEGKADPNKSCITLTYHYSSGKSKPQLNLNTDAAKAYINGVTEPRKSSTLMQLRNTMVRMASGDPEMEGPTSFSTTETCGPETLKANPEALKKAEDAYKEANSWTNKLKFW